MEGTSSQPHRARATYLRQSGEIQEKQQGMQNNHSQVGILNTLLGKVSEDYMPIIPQRRKKKRNMNTSRG